MCQYQFWIKFHYIRKLFMRKHKMPDPPHEWVDVDEVKRDNTNIEITKLEIKETV